MVAPSFQSYKFITEEPFTKNGKLYVTVEHPNTHNHRDVRWYTEAEYKKAYPKSAAAAPADGLSGLKQARGFSKGPIIVLRGGDRAALPQEWTSASIARYATDIGWYIASTDTIPSDMPSSIVGIPLSWDEMRDGDDRHVKSPAALRSLISAKLKENRDLIRKGV